MIHSRTGLALLAAIALLLAIALAWPRATAPGLPDRALAPGLAADSITGLEWSYPDGTVLAVGRPDAASPWTLETGDHAGTPVDPTAVDAALAALRGGRWHRRAVSARAGSAATLVVHGGLHPLVVHVSALTGGAAPLDAPAGQTWIGRGDAEALLVDDWIARALAPVPLALVVRQPLAGAAAATAIELAVPEGPAGPAATVRLVGTPRQRAGAAPFLVDPTRVAALDAALDAVEITALPAAGATTRGGPVDLTITITLAARGAAAGVTTVSSPCFRGPCACPDRTMLLVGPSGAGCITVDAFLTLETQTRALSGDPLAVVDPRPLPGPPPTITLADRATLALSPPALDGAPADPDRVAELVAVLVLPARPVPLPLTMPVADAGHARGHARALRGRCRRARGRAGRPRARSGRGRDPPAPRPGVPRPPPVARGSAGRSSRSRSRHHRPTPGPSRSPAAPSRRVDARRRSAPRRRRRGCRGPRVRARDPTRAPPTPSTSSPRPRRRPRPRPPRRAVRPRLPSP